MIVPAPIPDRDHPLDATSRSSALQLGHHRLVWGTRTYIMGILNVTPDSFSDGGECDRVDTAIARAREMIAAGADILDLGGQSTRPGAEEVGVEIECDRVIPVITAIRAESDIPISIDTYHSTVARAAIAAGANLVNDVTGGQSDTAMLPTIAELGVAACLMHMRGTPKTMQSLTQYDDVVADVADALRQCLDHAHQAGIDRDRLILDPGIGFAKTHEQNIALLRRLSELRQLGYPLLLGVSRKSFIGTVLDRPDPKQRVWGTGAACSACIAAGADILRVHDVAEMRDISRVADAIYRD
ncbi:MAG: dihydropteroate synthase [Coleofasciculaceae cyanobacterium RL_1_1]|nr:dihydropteroate synthase [Coleofasciculaceae cyanobacterium RL_1_1]